jgi:hypothetical protein
MELMATADYETVLREARQLTPEERQRLRDELAADDAPAEPSGARFIAFLDTMPLTEADERDYDLMEQAIEEGCERIDHSEW